MDLGGSRIQVSNEVPVNVLTWLAFVSPTLLPFIIEDKEGTISYNLQCLIRQLGYGRLAIQVAGEMGCSNILTAEEQVFGKGMEHIVTKFQSIFWPNKARVGVRSPGGSIYWKKSLLCDFVLNQDERL